MPLLRTVLVESDWPNMADDDKGAAIDVTVAALGAELGAPKTTVGKDTLSFDDFSLAVVGFLAVDSC